MYLAITFALGVALLVRRYKLPKYSIQKFSRCTSLINRTIIPPLRVPWKVKFDNYDPVRTERHEFHFWWFKLCFTDGRTRLLCETSAFLFARVPYNPFGRTGVSGRGIFKYWGPNRFDVVVYTNKNNHIGIVKKFYHKVKTLRNYSLIHSGYIDHPANTDNAWFEGNIYACRKHDLVEDIRGDYPWLVDMFKYSTPPPQKRTCDT